MEGEGYGTNIIGSDAKSLLNPILKHSGNGRGSEGF